MLLARHIDHFEGRRKRHSPRPGVSTRRQPPRPDPHRDPSQVAVRQGCDAYDRCSFGYRPDGAEVNELDLAIDAFSPS
jgi:hypothetical protein